LQGLGIGVEEFQGQARNYRKLSSTFGNYGPVPEIPLIRVIREFRQSHCIQISLMPSKMRTLLICHAGDKLDEVGLARWLSSFSTLAGVVIIRETNQRMWKRIRREIKRVGLTRFPDVLAFRFYYRLVHAARDGQWEEQRLKEICDSYREPGEDIPTLSTWSPNSAEALEFIKKAQPDIMIARCKTLLKESIFSIPTRGTFVMHPGICPEYRNAHGCFWALANGDAERVGMTLLRIDKGVDTGSVYGYYTCDFDEVKESHAVIQRRVVVDNFDALRQKLEEIYLERAKTIDTTGRSSATWGQPWLSRHLRWKWKARRKRNSESHIAAIS
jgi:folate-dependent phosphoribosylglycinamide formyltransferase PurN